MKQILNNCVWILALQIMISGCVEQTTQTEEEITGSGRLRFIHCASSTGELDLAYRDLTDNNFYLAEENVNYGFQYGYYSLHTGSREFRLYETSNNIAVSAGTVLVENGKKYTLMAVDYEATLNDEMLALKDTVATPEAGKTFVRFIHVGADVAAIQIGEEQNGVVISRLEPLGTSHYLHLDAGTYRFHIYDTSGQNVILNLSPMTFLDEFTYSVILSGTVTGLTPVEFNARLFTETSL